MVVINRGSKDRSRIDLSDRRHVRHWTRTLGVDEDALARAIAKVGDQAAAVRKELGGCIKALEPA
jgi:hypothetical protein